VGPRGYLGTADAVYQHLSLVERIDPAHVLILGSNHVYQIDYRHLLQFRRADVRVAMFPVPRHQASQFGMVTVDPLGEVTPFLEKPRPESPLSTMKLAVFGSKATLVRQVAWSFDKGCYIKRMRTIRDPCIDATSGGKLGASRSCHSWI
jgi:ADP-glucose pyrophosphorylase